ncbi:76fe000b-d3f0-4998-9076-924f658405b5 [Sclerotinia trifoliorum]|uniref:76fe000b-d3f0-4998-9076-924f658405b5 n=1 Tax=Sclerotinia trifoliorum TaxID=28548 RepID=A0A8H2VXW8_9HELO|nr:76fe000b-d3f0-4998-9076-924f658405b5 [Sclerotinia trifoliorum]
MFQSVSTIQNLPLFDCSPDYWNPGLCFLHKFPISESSGYLTGGCSKQIPTSTYNSASGVWIHFFAVAEARNALYTICVSAAGSVS